MKSKRTQKTNILPEIEKDEVDIMNKNLESNDKEGIEGQFMQPEIILNNKGETIQLISNPLPLPKKHIPKTMEFDLDVPEEQMHYDLNEIKNNDFDLE